MTTRLLIVDDDPEITSALARGLALHGYDTLTQNRADLALDLLINGDFSGAIIDVMLGADSGIDLVRTARAAGATLPIVMLSALSDVEHRAAGLEAGADDYIIKPFNFDELVARLRVQEHRASAQHPDVVRLSANDRTLCSGLQCVTLTEREYALLALLTTHGETPLPRLEIYNRLWATEGSGSENVVDVYIGYLRKKLCDHDFGFEIKTLRNQGFCLIGRLPIISTP